jgi:ParB family transcriptional regulator, chromosome partitioning protein
MSKRTGLGRGLSALMGEISNDTAPDSTSGEHQHIALDKLVPGLYQPRKFFYEEDLQELSDSIKQNGVLQPLIVRPLNDGIYQIIAGERRWRASKLAGLTTVPVLVKNLTDKEALEFAIIENIQRQDLNPLEEAEGYMRLMEEFSYTQEALGKSLGKSRSHIANLLRLLTLPDEIKEYIYDGSLSMGHARTLVNAENNVEVAKHIIKEGLNVRQVEQLLRNGQPSKKSKTPSAGKVINEVEKDEDIASLEKSLSESLGMKVKIEDGARGGKVTIQFNTVGELDAILQRLSGSL